MQIQEFKIIKLLFSINLPTLKLSEMDEKKVILVNENDEERGFMGKTEAHQKGELHRAFSVFILNDKGGMMLHKRADSKYHTPGLWTNACCSHPQPNETVLIAARRRLSEELGFTCDLEKLFNFTYRADFENGLTEHEFDHVFLGYYNGIPPFDTEEMSECDFFSTDLISTWVEKKPEEFTPWFKIAYPKVLNYLKSKTAE